MIIEKPNEDFFKTAKLFVVGGVVTGLFSASLARLTPNVDLPEVLITGLVIPSLTWIVQLGASSMLLKAELRRKYHDALGRVCLLGSMALLPAALANVCLSHPPFWISAAHVVVSVLIMAGELFRRAGKQGISRWWPVSWCVTIVMNIALFLWVSRDWWRLPV